jgi:site-specific recombinase XerD
MGAHDRALLWVLFDSGITVSEGCALRVSDLDRSAWDSTREGEKRQGSSGRLGGNQPEASALLAGPVSCTARTSSDRERCNEHPLFCTAHRYPLSRNSLTLLFRRLCIRVGMHDIPLSPQLLRHSFALRYLQAGGDPCGLKELFGYADMAPVKQYLRWHE